jgi:hypothetical protein
MTGDHHGQAAAMATLLVRAVDGILGMHRPVALASTVAGRPPPPAQRANANTAGHLVLQRRKP